jgi:hypothetical protein
MSKSGRNLKIAPHRQGCRLVNDNTDERFANPLLRVWCSKDKPPKGYVEVDRLGEMPRYYGYYERVGE